MTRYCRTCSHPQRAEIDTALLAHTESQRRLAARFGLSEPGIRRHANDCLGVEIRQDRELRKIANGLDVLERLANLDRLNLQLLKSALAENNRRDAASLIRANVAVLEAYAKLQANAPQPAIEAAPVQYPVPDEPTTREVLKIMIESGMFEQVAHEMEQEKPLEVVEDEEPEDDRAYGV